MKLLFLFLSFITINSFAQNSPKTYGEVPSKRQLAWHDIEIYGLIHFTPTTFDNKEWGYGGENLKYLIRQILMQIKFVKAAKKGGLKGIIIVAKHHNGFALWPTKTTDYNIKKSPFRNGKGDLVKEMILAACKQGLKFGICCSPWDKNSAKYVTSVFKKSIKRSLKNYILIMANFL